MTSHISQFINTLTDRNKYLFALVHNPWCQQKRELTYEWVDQVVCTTDSLEGLDHLIGIRTCEHDDFENLYGYKLLAQDISWYFDEICKFVGSEIPFHTYELSLYVRNVRGQIIACFHFAEFELSDTNLDITAINIWNRGEIEYHPNVHNLWKDGPPKKAQSWMRLSEAERREWSKCARWITRPMSKSAQLRHLQTQMDAGAIIVDANYVDDYESWSIFVSEQVFGPNTSHEQCRPSSMRRSLSKGILTGSVSIENLSKEGKNEWLENLIDNWKEAGLSINKY